MAGTLLHNNGNQRVHAFSAPNLSRPSLFNRPMRVIAMPNHQTYWASIIADIEAHLKQAIPIRPPLVVSEPMHHLTFAAPQTTASALCLAACELVGGRKDQAVAAASAVHLMHAALFTHEHLPLSTRPGSRLNFHHAYGPNVELLIGDGMIPFALELLAKSNDQTENNSDLILQVIVEITRAVGSQGVLNGRYREILCTQSESEEVCGTRWVDEVTEKKEGELHACGAACGAILGGGSEEEVEKLRKFGFYVGVTQGLLNRGEREEKDLGGVIEEMRKRALKELEDFDKEKTEAISSLVGLI